MHPHTYRCMCIYVYAIYTNYIGMCIACAIYTKHMYAHIYHTHVCVCTQRYTCMHICMCVLYKLNIYSVYAHTTNECMCAPTHVYVHMHVYMCVWHIHVNICVCTHMHRHNCKFGFKVLKIRKNPRLRSAMGRSLDQRCFALWISK